MKTKYRNFNILDVPLHEPSANAIGILKKRYFRGEDADYAAMCQRVANAVSKAEAEDVRDTFESLFYSVLSRALFLPNSPTWMNANRPLGQLSGCFVLPVGDSIVEIFEAQKQTAIIHQTGGGTGFSFSRLRQSGARVNSTGGGSSGPLVFMDSFNATTESIKQGGARRGANMGVLSVHHPDILKFIRYKKDQTKLNNFNISVAITDEFMKALESESDFDLIEPHTGKVTGQLNALDVFNEIISSAHESGEPGIIFIDEINRYNPTPHIGTFETTNPCGEQPLLPWESCNLGSINLALMVKDGKVNWKLMKDTVHIAVRFLDDVIDVNKYPLQEIADMTRNNRKIGLGVMGWADMLAQTEMAYDSNEGLCLGETVMCFINDCAHAASTALAAEKGCFPNYKGSVPEKDGILQRNAVVTTIAPTGTISIIGGASSGIEPYFAVHFRRDQADMIMFETLPIFEKIAKREGFWSEELLKETAKNNGSVAHCKGVPDDIKPLFRTAHDISPEDHVKMQAVFQAHTDNAVSKTVNFSNMATKADVEKTYRLAYTLKCKGITIYRDGSRDKQVLSANNGSEKTTNEKDHRQKRERPESLKGHTYDMKTGCGSLYVTINGDPDDPDKAFEVFTTMGKAGGCAASQCEAIGRTTSLALRWGVSVENLVKQLIGVSCHKPSGFGDNKILSCADAVAKALRHHLINGDDIAPMSCTVPKDQILSKELGIEGDLENGKFVSKEDHIKEALDKMTQGCCPECGGPIEHESGCGVCRICGFSECA